MKRWILRLTYPAIVAAFFVSGMRWHHVDDGDPSLHFRHWHDALFVAFVLVLLGMDIGGSIAFAAVNRVLRGEPLTPAWLRRIWARLRLLLLAFGLAFATGCAALSSLLGPAATALSAYEEAAQKAEAAKATAKSNEELRDAVEKLRAEAKRAADAEKLRDDAAKKRAEAAKAKLDALAAELARPCPSCPVCPTLPQAPALPVVDAGAEGGL